MGNQRKHQQIVALVPRLSRAGSCSCDVESEPSIGVAANDSIVFNCCGKAVKCVHLNATVDLAEYYLNGQGIKTDIGVALELLSDVPERGSSDVMRRLASI